MSLERLPADGRWYSWASRALSAFLAVVVCIVFWPYLLGVVTRGRGVQGPGTPANLDDFFIDTVIGWGSIALLAVALGYLCMGKQ